MTPTPEDTVAQVAARRHWREADARIVVVAWRESGMSQTRFAHEHQIQPERLARWVRRLRRDAEPPAAFHEVRVRPQAPRAVDAEQRIEVVLPDGRAIRVPHAFAAEDLRRVLAVLERVSC